MSLVVKSWYSYKPWWGFGKINRWVEVTHHPRNQFEAKRMCERLRRAGAGARIEYNGEIVSVNDAGKLVKTFG